MSPALIIDGILLILLCVTLFIGIRLSRQFAEIRSDQNRMIELVGNLNVASARAEKAVASMKQAAVDTGENLQGQIGQGQALCEELEIMIEAGDSLAERLQVIAESSRKAVGQSPQGQKKHDQKKPAPAKGAGATKDAAGEDEPRSRAERELVEALKSRNDKG
jgi:hypothetical protein